jgi:mannose-6-phosphate isomerase-like protein (cupin superfamily)
MAARNAIETGRRAAMSSEVLPGREGVRGYMLKPGEGVAGFGSDVKASSTSTGGVITLIESRTDGGAPLHVHSRQDECFYVLEGTITVQCGEDRFEAGAGSFVFLPRGVPHSWDVVGEVATVLIITVPAMLEEFLRDFHAEGADRSQVAERYGITFLRG